MTDPLKFEHHEKIIDDPEVQELRGYVTQFIAQLAEIVGEDRTVTVFSVFQTVCAHFWSADRAMTAAYLRAWADIIEVDHKKHPKKAERIKRRWITAGNRMVMQAAARDLLAATDPQGRA